MASDKFTEKLARRAPGADIERGVPERRLDGRFSLALASVVLVHGIISTVPFAAAQQQSLPSVDTH